LAIKRADVRGLKVDGGCERADGGWRMADGRGERAEGGCMRADG
jgi:hypothetical protein